MKKATLKNTLCLISCLFTTLTAVAVESTSPKTIPISQIPDVNIVKMATDYDLPYIYLLHTSTDTEKKSSLIWYNTEQKIIEKILPAGVKATDLSIHYDDDRIYVSANGVEGIRVFDRSAKEALPDLPVHKYVYRLGSGPSGLLITEDDGIGNAYYCQLHLWNNQTAAHIQQSTSYSIGRGTGESDVSGRYYYHADTTAYPYTGMLRKYDLSSGKMVQIKAVNAPKASLRELVISGDGSRIFWNNSVYDSELDHLYDLGKPTYTASSHGELAVTQTEVLNGISGATIYTLPGAASAMAFSGDQSELLMFDTSGRQLTSIAVSDITGAPLTKMIPVPANNSVEMENLPQLTWSGAPRALAYDIYVGTDSNAVANANTNSTVFLGRQTSTDLALPSGFLAGGQTYYWRVDMIGYDDNLTSGAVWTFHTSKISTASRAVNVAGVSAAYTQTVLIAISDTANPDTTWTASCNANWLQLKSSGGTGSGSLEAEIPMTDLAPGTYTTEILLNDGTATLTISVTLEVEKMRIIKMATDYDLPYIYMAHTSTTTPNKSRLIWYNTDTDTIEQVLDAGENATDLTVSYADNRIYVSNWKRADTQVFDRTSKQKLSPLQLGGDVYKINAGRAGRVHTEGEDQWVRLSMRDTSNSSEVAYKSTVREGDGDCTLDGRFYYHCDNNSSGATIQKYDVTADAYTQVASKRTASYYGSRNIFLNMAGTRVYNCGTIYDSDLNILLNIGSEIYAASAYGDMVLTSTKAYNGVNGTAVYTLPFTSSVMAFSGDQSELLLFNSTSGSITSLATSVIMPIPEPGMIPNQTGYIGQRINLKNTIAAGFVHSLAVKTDGTLISWGSNRSGQTNSPTGSSYVAVAGGNEHSIALKSDGTLSAWGAENLGRGAINYVTDVPPGNDYIAIDGGVYSSIALKSDGTITSWGSHSNYGHPPPGSNYVAIAVGDQHGLALKADGSLVGWGDNYLGQISVPSGNDFVAIAAGNYHSLALKSDGSLIGWSKGYFGQVDVPPGNDYVAIDAGDYFSIALKSDGSLTAWGRNDYGQTDVPEGNDYIAIAAGGFHSLAMKSDGTVVAWGNNEYGQTDVPSFNAKQEHISGGVLPSNGLVFGNYQVVITGTNLCKGIRADVVDVLLCGTSVASIDSVSPDRIVVTAASGTAGIGDVVVQSLSYGTTTKENGFEYLKANQTVSFPTIGKQEVTNTIELTATATSGMDITFSVVSGPAAISTGDTLTFSRAGSVSIAACQAGDSKWNPACATHTFDVLGVITNVSPATGSELGGTAVTVSGLWLGSGTDITNVTLCGVEANVVSQDVHSVTVLSGATNIMTNLIGSVEIESGFGRVGLTNAFTYCPVPEPPTALSAVDITDSQFVARWKNNDATTTHYYMDVSDSTNFTAMTGIYSNWNAGASTACLVTGLVDGVTYWCRVRAANQYGSGLDSNFIEVPISTNTPYVKQEITNGVASAGSTDVVDLNNLFHGTGKSYQIIRNSNPILITATLDAEAGTLKLDYASGLSGMAIITVREWTEPNYSGFSVDNEITIYVTDAQPTWSADPVRFNLANGLFEQTVSVTNNSSYDAKSVTLTVADITAGATLYNATGTDLFGNSEVQWVGALGAGAEMDFTLQYYTSQMGMTPTGTVSVTLGLEHPDVELDESNQITLIGTVPSGSSFVIGFNATIGETYYIQYSATPAGPWKTAYPPIMALTKQVQWVDSGPPVTEPAGNSRVYRVIQAD